MTEAYDVVVIGGGNAGLCAAIAARDEGASVLLLEKGEIDERGGNSRFTAGAIRFAYTGAEEVQKLLPDISEAELEQTDFGSYPVDKYMDDLGRVTNYRCDPDLADTLVSESRPTMEWLTTKGVRFAPMYGRQAFKIEGRFRFWGGVTLEVVGGGPGLVEALYDHAASVGVAIRYETSGERLQMQDGRVTAVELTSTSGGREVVGAGAVVLACGGFESNPYMRAQLLGPGWDLARVRGTRHNTGDGIRMAVEAGAATAGHWSGCHAVAWDLNAPEFGDLAVGDAFQKHSYPLGIVVNVQGKRFLDEGADFRNYTYAKYGQEILRQPEQRAWQVFDGKVLELLRDEYRIREVSKVQASSLEALVSKMEGIDVPQFLETVERYNASIDTAVPFDPNVLDGRGTSGIAPPKSNWANTLDTPPFEAYAVTCGITFTFGGLRANAAAQVLDERQRWVDGLYACGEVLGGLFYFNYPGGTGLMSGAVFGKTAGSNAARRARSS